MTTVLAPLISDTARFLRRRFDARARTVGVSRAQWTVLFALSRNEGINQAGLADMLEVETITVGRMVDRLEEAGLVERRADPADRRAWRLHLMPRAHPVLGALRQVAETVMDEALVGIDTTERDRLVELLTRLRANLSGRCDPDLPAKSAGTR